MTMKNFNLEKFITSININKIVSEMKTGREAVLKDNAKARYNPVSASLQQLFDEYKISQGKTKSNIQLLFQTLCKHMTDYKTQILKLTELAKKVNILLNNLYQEKVIKLNTYSSLSTHWKKCVHELTNNKYQNSASVEIPKDVFILLNAIGLTRELSDERKNIQSRRTILGALDENKKAIFESDLLEGWKKIEEFADTSATVRDKLEWRMIFVMCQTGCRKIETILSTFEESPTYGFIKFSDPLKVRGNKEKFVEKIIAIPEKRPLVLSYVTFIQKNVDTKKPPKELTNLYNTSLNQKIKQIFPKMTARDLRSVYALYTYEKFVKPKGDTNVVDYFRKVLLHDFTSTSANYMKVKFIPSDPVDALKNASSLSKIAIKELVASEIDKKIGDIKTDAINKIQNQEAKKHLDKKISDTMYKKIETYANKEFKTRQDLINYLQNNGNAALAKSVGVDKRYISYFLQKYTGSRLPAKESLVYQIANEIIQNKDQELDTKAIMSKYSVGRNTALNARKMAKNK